MTIPKRGMILLNKQPGQTSFQALGACKRSFGTKKVGHAGTLDKFAEGLLLVFFNEATRLVPYFVGADKTYEATIRFGNETSTLDPEGVIVRSAPVPSLSEIESILPKFIGLQDQIPPAYSAIHIDGKRAYERARAGEEMDLKPRSITIHNIEIMEWHNPDLVIKIDCSSGTYIRSLARDIANAVASAASLSALKRTRVAQFLLDQSVISNSSPESLWWESGFYGQDCIADLLPNIKKVCLLDGKKSDFRNGKLINRDWFESTSQLIFENTLYDEQVCVIDSNGNFIGIIKKNNTGWNYQLVFPID